jgi:hypothetical protein
MQGIDLSRDAPDGNAIATGEPERRLGVLEERIVGLVEMDFPLEQKRRNPVRIVLVQPIWQAMKRAPQGATFDRNDRHGGTFSG